MGSWLQNILTPPTTTNKAGARNRSSLPVKRAETSHLPANPLQSVPQPPQALPNATVIYGIGASLLFVSSFSLLLAGRWFPGLVVFAVGGCLTGFAWHLLKHQD